MNMQKIVVAESKHKNPYISIIVTAFNEEKYLSTCLEHLSHQTYPRENYEIVVVDNNSTDNTVAIAKKYGARVITEKKQGYVFALNTGMLAGNGEIIAVTDADTKVAKNWLAVIALAFSDETVVGVTGIGQLDSGSKFFVLFGKYFYLMFAQLHFWIGKPHMGGPDLAVRKSALVQVGGLDTKFLMSPDVDLGMRLKKVGKVLLLKDMYVITSARRLEKNFIKAMYEYTKGYVCAIWLRRPPRVKQIPVR